MELMRISTTGDRHGLLFFMGRTSFPISIGVVLSFKSKTSDKPLSGHF